MADMVDTPFGPVAAHDPELQRLIDETPPHDLAADGTLIEGVLAGRPLVDQSKPRGPAVVLQFPSSPQPHCFRRPK